MLTRICAGGQLRPGIVLRQHYSSRLYSMEERKVCDVRGRETIGYTYQALSNVHRFDSTQLAPTINAQQRSHLPILRPSVLIYRLT